MCLAPQPDPRPQAELQPMVVAIDLRRGRAHHVGQWQVEHLGPEHLQRLANLPHDAQRAAPVCWRLRLRKAGLVHCRSESLPRSLEASATKGADDLERPRSLVGGRDAGGIPGVVVEPRRPRSERGGLGQGLAQLGDPSAADAQECIAVEADPRGRRLRTRPQLGKRGLCVECADAPGVSLGVQR